MRNLSLLTLVTLAVTFFVVSCKKEISYEQGAPSHGSLQSSSGNCLPKSVNGTYRVNQALGDTNTIDVTVNVTQIGAYIITSDTLNGYYFRASGTFGATGTQTVNLKGIGKPAATGVNTFTVSYDSSVCTIPVTVLAATTTTTTGNGAFTLQTSGSSCMNATVSGTYTQGTALSSSNTVAIQINVTTVGSWTLSTNSLTGFSFAGAGTFTATGPQFITLTGSGIPTAAGTQTFTVSAGNTTCTFSVTVVAPIPPSTDHFIITDNSWWSYSTPVNPSDTLKRSIIGSATGGGFTYKAMKELNVLGQLDDTLYFRKSGNNYYEFNYVDYYTSFYLDQLVTDSLLFLKEGLTSGQTWSSAVYTGTVQGQATKIRYDYTCTNNNATITLNGKTYTNVYQVTLNVMVDDGTGFAPDITWTNYYAQGIGWIYQKYDDNQGSSYDLPIRYYQVF